MDALKHWVKEALVGNYTPLKLSPNDADLNTINLTDVIAAHNAWLDKLETTLKGQNPEEYDPEIVGADHLCALGKWMNSDGLSLSNLSEFANVKSVHAAFHQCAGEILQKHKAGKFADAITMLRNKLPDLSRQVQVHLVSLLIAYKEKK
ncbi:MAG: CZB domain-containing protein [Neisseriaceae bacterium]|nr:CZB domain-containing protein [Neisseriaceae bacterium]